MSKRTLNLLRGIDSGRIGENYIDELVEYARINKLLLGFLRRIDYNGPIRAREEFLYKQYMVEVANVSKILGNIDYALFKFRKPIEHVSVDIDILIRYEHLLKAVKNLAEAGFRIEILEPYTVTMIKCDTIVDLYTNPSFAWIMYLDGERLLEEVETIKIDYVDADVKALTQEAEVIATATHAIYKEHIYLLTDYYVLKEWLNNKVLDLARELNVEDAIQICLKLNKHIEGGYLETPIKFNFPQTVKILTTRFMKDSNFRSTTINTVKLATKKRTIQQLISRIKRKSY